MSGRWPRVRLGEVLRRTSETFAPEPDATYQEVTVRLWGKGVVKRGAVLGAQLAGQRRFTVRAGQFILSRIDARNGAFGLVPPELDGAVVSNDFPAFDVERTRLDPAYLGWLSRTADFVAMCRGASEGTTNRVRLSEPKFLDLTVALPSLPEQRRIVARLDAVAATLRETKGMRREVTDDMDALLATVLRDLFPMPNGTRIGDVVRFQTGYAFKSEWFSDKGIRLIRNANVGHGCLDWSEVVRLAPGREAEFDRFILAEGDILVSLDRPIISTGVKVARVRQTDLPALLLQRVARARLSSDALRPDYLYCWLRSPCFIQAIAPGRSNGVPHISHKDIECLPFAVPNEAEQERIVSRFNALLSAHAELRRDQVDAAAEAAALLPALLRRAFA